MQSPSWELGQVSFMVLQYLRDTCLEKQVWIDPRHHGQLPFGAALELLTLTRGSAQAPRIKDLKGMNQCLPSGVGSPSTCARKSFLMA